MRMMARCELVDAQQALAWGLADAVIGETTADHDVRAFLEPLLSCRPQVLRGIKAQTSSWRRSLTHDERRSTERRQFVNTWLHQDHWDASEKLLPRKENDR
jgi:enoyl-CoA hydratase